MHFYRVINGESEGTDPSWSATLADAHADAKLRFSSVKSFARIELVDIDTSKAGVLSLLQTGNPTVVGVEPVLRTWGLTARGGLTELPNGE